MKTKRTSCCDLSSTISKIRKEKGHGTLMDNGDSRIGNNIAICNKTHIIYELK